MSKKVIENTTTSSIVSKIVNIHSQSTSVIFEDILNLYIATFSFGTQEKLYQEVRNRYSKTDFQELVHIYTKIVSVYYDYVEKKQDFDLLGDIYESLASSSKASALGQFFTPLVITKLLSLLAGISQTENIIFAQEPSCGSGRNCISAFNLNNNIVFNAIDVDRICVKMTAVNMHLYNMIGSEVIHGDSISGEVFGGYRIALDSPNIKFMFGELWNDFNQEKQEYILKTFENTKTIVIKEIYLNDIINTQSVNFILLQNRVHEINKYKSLFRLLDNYDKIEHIPPKEVNKDVLELEEGKQIKFASLKASDYNFKKTRKFENQISFFED